MIFNQYKYICVVLAREITIPVLLSIVTVIGVPYLFWIFGTEFILGRSEFWIRPRGLFGGELDIGAVLSGYYWFAQDIWRWPLLDLPHINFPAGTNAGLFDAVPLAAIFGKLVFGIFGLLVNPFPAFITLNFFLCGLSLSILVWCLGQRTLLACVLSSLIGLMTPILYFRFGHIGHCAHWTFIFALAAYVATVRQIITPLWSTIILILLCFFATSINLYLYVMVSAIAVSAALQSALDRRASAVGSAAGTVAILAAGIVPTWAYGVLAYSSIRTRTLEFGEFSMNLMAPFWPQSSGALQWTELYIFTRGSVGATKGQYEGFCYLGLGAILILIISTALNRNYILKMVRYNWILFTILFFLTLWALSNKIYLGQYLIFSYPVPDLLQDTIFAWFRSSGRFFWPVAWLLVALGIAGAITKLPIRTAPVVALTAIALQWADISLLRGKVAAVIEASGPSALGSSAQVRLVQEAIAGSQRLVMLPSIYCLQPMWEDYDAAQYRAAVELQILAARANAISNSAFVARPNKDCTEESNADLRTLVGPGVLISLSQAQSFNNPKQLGDLFRCHELSFGLLCNAPSR